MFSLLQWEHFQLNVSARQGTRHVACSMQRHRPQSVNNAATVSPSSRTQSVTNINEFYLTARKIAFGRRDYINTIYDVCILVENCCKIFAHMRFIAAILLIDSNAQCGKGSNGNVTRQKGNRIIAEGGTGVRGQLA